MAVDVVKDYGDGTYGGTLYGALVDTAEPNMLVQIQSGGSWVDVTCDVRSINTDRGRSSYLEANTAGTMDLVLANFQGLYSGWNPYGIWANANPYRTNLPIQIVHPAHGAVDPMRRRERLWLADAFCQRALGREGPTRVGAA